MGRREVLPHLSAAAMIVNPNFAGAETEMTEVEAAGRILGVRTRRLSASKASEPDAAFVTFAQGRVDAVMVGTDGFFIERRHQIAALANRYRVVGVYPFPEFPAVGGLMSYGPNLADGYRQPASTPAACSGAPNRPICRSFSRQSWTS